MIIFLHVLWIPKPMWRNLAPHWNSSAATVQDSGVTGLLGVDKLIYNKNPVDKYSFSEEK